MFHEETADQVMLVADAALGDRGRGKQDARIFDAAGRQHEVPGAHVYAASARCVNVEPLNRR